MKTVMVIANLGESTFRADAMKVTDAGILELTLKGNLVVAYAPGQWKAAGDPSLLIENNKESE